MPGRVLLSIKLTARLADVTVPAVRAAIRRGRLKAVTLARDEHSVVRCVDMREAARYYGWPPALADRLADEMRAGVPEERDVYKLDEVAGEPDGAGHPDSAADASRIPGQAAFSGAQELAVGVDLDASPSSETQLGRMGPTIPAPDVVPEPASASEAWKRAVKKLADRGQMPNDAPPGFRLILPRGNTVLLRREVYDLLVDGEVVGTMADEGFANYVAERCHLGEVFVNGRGAVKWRPRIPLEGREISSYSPFIEEK